jgi:hypothetical protein
MKAKLIKLNRGYYNLEDEKGNVIGTSYQFKSSVGDAIKYKLSQQNCDEIFGIVDVEKLADEYIVIKPKHREYEHNLAVSAYIEGFNKAMELNKDKLFTLDDMKKAFEKGCLKLGNNRYFDELIESLNKNEWEVEVVMDRIPADLAPGGWDVFPKLDSQGCIILKRVV